MGRDGKGREGKGRDWTGWLVFDVTHDGSFFDFLSDISCVTFVINGMSGRKVLGLGT